MALVLEEKFFSLDEARGLLDLVSGIAANIKVDLESTSDPKEAEILSQRVGSLSYIEDKLDEWVAERESVISLQKAICERLSPDAVKVILDIIARGLPRSKAPKNEKKNIQAFFDLWRALIE